MASNNNNPTHLKFLRFADLHVKEIEYIVRPYIPAGFLTLLFGDPGVGKTFLALYIAALLTRGLSFLSLQNEEHAVQGTPRNVLFCTAEDDPESVLLPRFLKLNGDPDHMIAVRAQTVHTPTGEVESSVTLSALAKLQHEIAEYKPSLIVIDPLQGFLGADVDMYRPNEVRPVLTELSKLAADQHCAILMIGHMAKGDRANPLYKPLGSVDIAAAVRSMLLVGPNPNPPKADEIDLTVRKPTRCVLAHVKSNFGELGPSVAYRITDDGITFDGPVDLNASDLVPFVAGGRDKRLTVAKQLLRELLSNGPKTSKEIYAEADARHISRSTLDRAAKEIGVIPRPAGFQKPWMMQLPGDEVPVETLEDANTSAARDV